MEFTQIIYDKSDRIATVTMNRPDKLNAWTQQMGDEMRQAMFDAERDESIGAIVVTGAGRAYCAGADMGALSEISTGRAPAGGPAVDDESLSKEREDFRTRYLWPPALKKPVISAINGACVGLGFTHCLYHDIRIASDRARMGLIFVQRGLAIEHGSSWMLPRIVGLSHAMELAVTGRLDAALRELRPSLAREGVALDANVFRPTDFIHRALDDITQDLVIGAVLVVGARAPKLVGDDLVARMRQGSVLVDISIDQGGCFESSRPTTHSNPTFGVHDSIFYCVANMPGAVPHSSTHALANATLPYVVALANRGWQDAVRADAPLAEGVNVVGGEVTYQPVADAHGMAYRPLSTML